MGFIITQTHNVVVTCVWVDGGASEKVQHASKVNAGDRRGHITQVSLPQGEDSFRPFLPSRREI